MTLPSRRTARMSPPFDRPAHRCRRTVEHLRRLGDRHRELPLGRHARSFTRAAGRLLTQPPGHEQAESQQWRRALTVCPPWLQGPGSLATFALPLGDARRAAPVTPAEWSTARWLDGGCRAGPAWSRGAASLRSCRSSEDITVGGEQALPSDGQVRLSGHGPRGHRAWRAQEWSGTNEPSFGRDMGAPEVTPR